MYAKIGFQCPEFVIQQGAWEGFSKFYAISSPPSRRPPCGKKSLGNILHRKKLARIFIVIFFHKKADPF